MISFRYIGPCFQLGAKFWVNKHGAGIVVLVGPFLFEVMVSHIKLREDRFGVDPQHPEDEP